MITLKIKKKTGNKYSTLSLQVPESWHEVTVGQYLALEELTDKEDLVGFIAVLADSDRDTVGEIDSPKVIAKMRAIIAAILAEPIKWKKLIHKIPKSVLVKGKRLKVKDFGKFTLAQSIEFERAVRDAKPESQEDLVRLIPDALAIGLQPEYYGAPFHKDRHPEMKEIINAEPIIKMISPAYFFLTILLYSLASGAISSLTRAARTRIGKVLESNRRPPVGKSSEIFV